jgi:hypothetical protein
MNPLSVVAAYGGLCSAALIAGTIAGRAWHPGSKINGYRTSLTQLLTKLLLMPDQSPSAFQSVGYRMPLVPVSPGQFNADDYTIYNSRPTYGHAIKSVIFSPLPEDHPSSGDVEISGAAFNDGLAPIRSVDVSTDGGKSWRAATIKPAESPWAWYHWTARGRLAPGSNVLMSVATDALGRTQPADGLTRWNPRGYEWNGVEAVVVSV